MVGQLRSVVLDCPNPSELASFYENLLGAQRLPGDDETWVVIVANGTRLAIPLPDASAGPGKRSVRLTDVEKEHVRRVLEATGWRIRGPSGAASCLGLRPTTLETRMARLGLKRPRH